MREFVAALPMYDWPETRAEVDAEWAAIRERLVEQDIDAPLHLVRRNAEMPPVHGGIRDPSGTVIAPDPATLPPEELDRDVLWRHPDLLLAQTCWGPLDRGLEKYVRVVAQPDYSAFPGGAGPDYSSAILMRRADVGPEEAAPPKDGRAVLPLDRLAGGRFAYNGSDSMSGLLALQRDLEVAGGFDLLTYALESGSHRASIVAVANGDADFCAIDCRSLALARRFEPHVEELVVVGWTARRRGLPLIAARAAPAFTLS